VPLRNGREGYRVQAHFTNGVLELRLPKGEAATPKRIAIIEAGSPLSTVAGMSNPWNSKTTIRSSA
jgi:hypothetical protein